MKVFIHEDIVLTYFITALLSFNYISFIFYSFLTLIKIERRKERYNLIENEMFLYLWILYNLFMEDMFYIDYSLFLFLKHVIKTLFLLYILNYL